MILPYVAGISEDVRRVCRRFGLTVIFKSRRSLRSVLTKVKDTLPAEKQSKVVYQIPCSCGRAYIGETTRRLETRMKEHQDACCRRMVEKLAMAEHAWEHHHPIEWEATRVIDRAGKSKEPDSNWGTPQPGPWTGSTWLLASCPKEKTKHGRPRPVLS